MVAFATSLSINTLVLYTYYYMCRIIDVKYWQVLLGNNKKENNGQSVESIFFKGESVFFVNNI